MTSELRPELTLALAKLKAAIEAKDYCARCGDAPPTYIAVRSEAQGTIIFGYKYREQYNNFRRAKGAVEEMICDACVESELKRRLPRRTP